MDLLFVSVGTVICFYIIHRMNRKSYARGFADSMRNYTGIVNIKKRLNQKTGMSYYHDMANDIFLFQTDKHNDAITYLEQVFVKANMLVFSMEDITDESI